MKRRLPQIMFASRMNRTNVGKQRSFSRYLTNEYFLFLAGIILGCVLSRFATLPEFLSGTTKLLGILEKTSDFVFKSYFLESLILCLSTVAVVFVLGFTAAAVPIIYLVPVFRGFAFGVMMTQVYAAFDIKGALICLVSIVPYAAITVVSIGVLSLDSAMISSSLTRFLFSGNVSGIPSSRIRKYFEKLILSSALAAVGAFLHCLGIKLLLPVM